MIEQPVAETAWFVTLAPLLGVVVILVFALVFGVAWQLSASRSNAIRQELAALRAENANLREEVDRLRKNSKLTDTAVDQTVVDAAITAATPTPPETGIKT
jgi:type II secretory pathway component PulM